MTRPADVTRLVRVTRPVGVVALVVGAALTVLGTFLPAYSLVFDMPYQDSRFEHHQNMWHTTGGNG